MIFESNEQLANHVKRFCINSDYGNSNKLEQKHDYVTKSGYAELKPSVKQQDPPSVKNQVDIHQYVDLINQDQIKSNLKTNDDDFKNLENAVLTKREDELIDQIDKLKQDRQQMRVVNDQDEHIYSILLQEVELKMEREFQCRIEKEQIRKVINEIDSWKMSVLEEQKKQILEKLLVKREDLKNKQLQLIEDIRIYTRGHKTFFSMEQAQRITDNRIIASAQYSEAKYNQLNYTQDQNIWMQREIGFWIIQKESNQVILEKSEEESHQRIVQEIANKHQMIKVRQEIIRIMKRLLE